MWSSAHRHKCGHLITEEEKNSSAHKKKLGRLLRDKSVVICSQIKVWLSAQRQKCGYMPGPSPGHHAWVQLLSFCSHFPLPPIPPPAGAMYGGQCLHRRLSMCSAASTPLVNIPCFVSALSRHAVHTSQTSWLFLRQQAHTINFKTN